MKKILFLVLPLLFVMSCTTTKYQKYKNLQVLETNQLAQSYYHVVSVDTLEDSKIVKQIILDRNGRFLNRIDSGKLKLTRKEVRELF